MSDDEEDPESCKVVLLGEAGVGKTSIIAQFIDQEFTEDQTPTTGATFSTKSIMYEKYKKEVSFEIWDTAGQEKYRALTKMFYKDASVAILVYDITRENSFTELKQYWAKQIKENAPKKIVIAIAANKSDLFEDEKVEESKGREFAKELGAIFKSTSAKNQSGIEELFREVGNRYLDPNSEFSDDAKEEERLMRERRRKTVKVKKEGNGQNNKDNGGKDDTDVTAGFKKEQKPEETKGKETKEKKSGCC